MHATDFGLTLIIANPAAQSGAAHEVAERLQRFLDMTARASQFDLMLTERMGHAKELAARTQGYRTVIALGGDGVIHEVVNGLMTQDEAVRPALAVLPVGSGNDFAQTLGIDQCSIHVKNNSLDHIGPPSTLAVALLQLYRIWQLVYNVYTILHFRYTDRSLMASNALGL